MRRLKAEIEWRMLKQIHTHTAAIMGVEKGRRASGRLVNEIVVIWQPVQ